MIIGFLCKDSVEMLILTFGVITGFGLSLCYVAGVVIVAYYFEKRRSFATGLSVCGGGIGTFIFSPLTSKLIGEKFWNFSPGNKLGFIVILSVPIYLRCIWLAWSSPNTCWRIFESLCLWNSNARLRMDEEEESKVAKCSEVSYATIKIIN